MRRTLAACLAAIFVFLLAGCGEAAQNSPTGATTPPVENPASETDEAEDETYQVEYSEVGEAMQEPADDAEVINYPYTDDEGRTRFLLMVNGNLVDTENDPFKYPDEIGAYYPLEDVLNAFGVSVVKTEDGGAVGSSINGNIFKAFNGVNKIVYGKKTIAAVDEATAPVLMDGVLYVPSFFFMQLSDNSIVDYSADGTCCTLDTDIVIDPSNSGPVGITAADLTPSSNKVTTTAGGSARCTHCGGAGGRNQLMMLTYDLNGRQISRSTWIPCSYCGGRGIL